MNFGVGNSIDINRDNCASGQVQTVITAEAISGDIIGVCRMVVESKISGSATNKKLVRNVKGSCNRMIGGASARRGVASGYAGAYRRIAPIRKIGQRRGITVVVTKRSVTTLTGLIPLDGLRGGGQDRMQGPLHPVQGWP